MPRFQPFDGTNKAVRDVDYAASIDALTIPTETTSGETQLTVTPSTTRGGWAVEFPSGC